MSDHLPECWYCDPDKIPAVAVNDGWPCICDYLRACEQRVNSSNLTMWNRTKEEAQHMIDAGLGIAWKDGFKEGLDAAREAVAAVLAYDDTEYSGQVVVQSVALAAIDALKEKDENQHLS